MKRSVFLFVLVLVLMPGLVSAHSYYMAGGRVSEEASTFLHVLNPGDDTADIVISVYYEKNDSSSFDLKAEPHSSMSLDMSGFASGNFGAVVDSDQPIVVDSVLYDSAYSGGFGSLAAEEPAFIWYFGEGYSSGMVKTYLYILNPDVKEANIGVTLYYNNGEKKTFNLNVPAGKYMSVDLKEKTQPEKRFGVKVTSTIPVVVSAGNFNKHFKAASGGIGANDLSKVWYFPDGLASDESSVFLNMVNPSFGVAHLTVTMYYEDGSSDSFEETVPANSKSMFMLNNYAEMDKGFSTVVESDINVIAELTVYDDSYSAGHGGLGATSAEEAHYFSSGLVSDKATTYLAVFNPSEREAELEITLYYSDGSVEAFDAKAPSLMRSTVGLDSVAAEGRGFGISLVSSEPVVVEEVVYDETYSAGYGYFGTPFLVEVDAVDDSVDDAVGQEVPQDDEYVLVKEQVVPASKFKDSISAGLNKAVKYEYEYKGSEVIAWDFDYVDHDASADALDAMLTGSLFKIVEVFPTHILGRSAHYFVSSKSAGYLWKNNSDTFIFISDKDDPDVAL
ncbi:TPA: hypothetical protein HA265_03095, partial [Candidatus Woesearchaeota archaeon]|nr:hypothetical protein [Candidatus Woesearchaeota archaeon]